MRLKYYLRGLGLGILVSTLFLMLSIQLHGGIMTDERVIARAKELGMVIPDDGETDTQTPEDESAQPDDAAQNDATQNDAAQGDAQQNDVAQDNATSEDAAQGDVTQDNAQPGDAVQGDAQQNDTTSDDAEQGDEAQNNAAQNDATQNDAAQDNTQDDIIFTVADGEVCRTAAEKLLACGLIEDVDAFRKYMSAHDYDGLIREGTYRIPVGADTETIAKIITAQVPEAVVTEDAEADSQ